VPLTYVREHGELPRSAIVEPLEKSLEDETRKPLLASPRGEQEIRHAALRRVRAFKTGCRHRDRPAACLSVGFLLPPSRMRLDCLQRPWPRLHGQLDLLPQGGKDRHQSLEAETLDLHTTDAGEIGVIDAGFPLCLTGGLRAAVRPTSGRDGKV
jgi:hypothetical protein